jgi:hypothetical protein
VPYCLLQSLLKSSLSVDKIITRYLTNGINAAIMESTQPTQLFKSWNVSEEAIRVEVLEKSFTVQLRPVIIISPYNNEHDEMAFLAGLRYGRYAFVIGDFNDTSLDNLSTLLQKTNTTDNYFESYLTAIQLQELIQEKVKALESGVDTIEGPNPSLSNNCSTIEIRYN